MKTMILRGARDRKPMEVVCFWGHGVGQSVERGAVVSALREEMKIIAWNCRGLGNGPVVRSLLNLQKEEDPNILFLSETKMDRSRIQSFRWNETTVVLIPKVQCPEKLKDL
jgi:hypothetical protein